MALDRDEIAVTIAIGAAGGFMGGLLGLGGGVLMIPLLVAAVGATHHEAHATSLAAIIPITAVAAVPFAFEGAADHRLAILLALGSLVGVPVGARFMARLDARRLRLLLAGFMGVVATRLVLECLLSF